MLSIIVPVYNEEECLAQCLDSLKNQTDSHFELIVVDNNSTDLSSEIARKYSENVLLEKEKGYHNAVKRGVQAANGELIAVCDADTIYHPDWVEKIHRLFKHEYVGIYGSVDFHDGTPVTRSVIRFFCFTVFMRLMLLFGIHVCNGFNFVFRKDAYLQVGGYDPGIYDKVGLDINLGTRLKQLGKLKFTPALRTRTSLRRILQNGLWNFLIINLSMYWALLLEREVRASYDEYNLK